MRAFLLAAGFGSRLRPITDLIPKPMVVVGDIPLVERAVRQLVAAGIDEIGINLFHLPELIRSYMGDGARFGARLTYFDERQPLPGESGTRREPLGTGGGLKNAEQFLLEGGDEFVLVNGDAWHAFDLSRLIKQHRTDAVATMAVYRDRRRPELHLLECGEDSRVLGISARPPMTLDELDLRDGGFRAIYTGVAVYTAQLLQRLPAGRVSGLVTHGISPAIRDGDRIDWIELPGLWIDCGTIEEVVRADVYSKSLSLVAGLGLGVPT